MRRIKKDDMVKIIAGKDNGKQGKAWNSGNKDQAAELYNLSLAIREEPENMYLLGRLYQNMGRTDEANTLFDKIIGAHPDSNYAERARQARGY